MVRIKRVPWASSWSSGPFRNGYEVPASLAHHMGVRVITTLQLVRVHCQLLIGAHPQQLVRINESCYHNLVLWTHVHKGNFLTPTLGTLKLDAPHSFTRSTP